MAMSTIGHNLNAIGQASEELFGNLFSHISLRKRPTLEYSIRNRTTVDTPTSLPLTGKVVIVTGSNRGIGNVVARDCASLGAQKVILAVRDVAKGQEARNEMIDSVGIPVEIQVKKLDLEDFNSVREFVQDIMSTETKIDILVNNAGILTGVERQEVDGMERMMRVNFFGSILLTLLLFPKIKETGDGKIVFVASSAHWALQKLDIDDLQWRNKPYSNNMVVYGHSKLALLTFLRLFAPKAHVHGVRTYAVDPGVAPTDIAKDSGYFHRMFIYGRMTRVFLRTTKEAADSVTMSVVADDKQYYNPNSFYFCDGSPKKTSKCVMEDEATARTLWNIVRTTLDLPIMDTI